MEEDARLVERFNRGDERAFDEIVSRHYQRVCNILFHSIGTAASIEDLAQDVFLKVYDALPKYRGDSTFSTWLYRIAVNAALDELRRIKRKRMLYFLRADELEGYERELGAALSSPRRPDQELERKELGETLQRAMNKLPAKQRVAFVLREVEGFSYTEIAGMLKCSLGTVKSRLFHARLKLRRYIKPYV
jgi:RNA polymerase sigma-70 factor (ECF subfamily)